MFSGSQLQESSSDKYYQIVWEASPRSGVLEQYVTVPANQHCCLLHPLFSCDLFSSFYQTLQKSTVMYLSFREMKLLQYFCNACCYDVSCKGEQDLQQRYNEWPQSITVMNRWFLIFESIPLIITHLAELSYSSLYELCTERYRHDTCDYSYSCINNDTSYIDVTNGLE